MTLSLSLSLSLSEENDDAAEEEAEGWRRGVVRGFRVKGWKAFLFAARVPTLHVVFTEKCTFTEMKETARLFVSSTRFQFLSLSLSLALNSLLLYFKPRSFFFEHGFSSSTRASVRGNRSRERIFHGERSLRLALLSPRLRHSPSFCARLNVISNRGRNCSPIQREREREQSSAKVGQGSTLTL